MTYRHQQRGSLMITAIVLIVTLALLSAVATRLFISQTRSSADHNLSQKALLLAESGLEKAKYELTQNPAYAGEVNTAFGPGTFSITILTTDFNGLALPAGQARISSIGNLTTAGSDLILRTVEEIITLPSESGWAAGNSGALLRWNGSLWSPITSNPFIFNIHDVTCSAADDCWFVGAGGNIGHWDGLMLSPVASGTTNDLNAVACDPNNADQCFAVGSGGTIRSWNSGLATWEGAPSSTTEDLNGIHCPDAKCYAVGNNGTILAYTGAWTGDSSVTSLDLFDIHCWSTNDCWAVGARNGQKFSIFVRAVSGWSDSSLTAPGNSRDLNGIACQGSPGNCWAMGNNGKAVEYNAGWSVGSSGTTATINDLWCSQSAAECWATGRAKAGNNTLLHWQPGPGWLNTPSSAAAITLNAIHFSPAAATAAALTTLAWREAIP